MELGKIIGEHSENSWEIVKDKKSGVLQSMVSQRVICDRVTEQQENIIEN